MKRNLIMGIVIISVISIVVFFAYLFWPVEIVKISPKDNDTNVPTDAIIGLEMNKKYFLNHFTIVVDSVEMAATEQKEDNVIKFTPKSPLVANKEYRVELKSNRSFRYGGNKVKSISWKFTTGEGTFEELNDMNFGNFFEVNPLARLTPYETDHFFIDWPDKNDVTTITLYAIFNAGVNGPPIAEQEKAYKEQLSAYKQEALDWIKSQGVDPNTLKIQWIPDETQ